MGVFICRPLLPVSPLWSIPVQAHGAQGGGLTSSRLDDWLRLQPVRPRPQPQLQPQPHRQPQPQPQLQPQLQPQPQPLLRPAACAATAAAAAVAAAAAAPAAAAAAAAAFPDQIFAEIPGKSGESLKVTENFTKNGFHPHPPPPRWCNTTVPAHIFVVPS
eukprot:gene8012-biopygen13631